MPSRRQTLAGIGGLLAGSLGVIGTAAFASSAVDRDAIVTAAGEGAGGLELDPVGDYATEVDGEVAFSFTEEMTGALNRNAVSVFGDQLAVRNRGSRPVFVFVDLVESAWATELGAVPFLSTPGDVGLDDSALVDVSTGRREYPLGGQGLDPENLALPVGAILPPGESLGLGLAFDVPIPGGVATAELTVTVYGVPPGSETRPGVFDAAESGGVPTV